MKKTSLLKLVLTVLLLTATTTVSAQDVFRSAGTSSKSYKYVEGQYLFDSGVDNPYILSAYYSVADNVALRFSHFRIGAVVSDRDGDPIDATLVNTWLGAVYHKPFNVPEGVTSMRRLLDGTDWIVGLDIGRQELSARGVRGNTAQYETQKDTLQRLYLGLRKGLGPKLEMQGGVNVQFGSGAGDESIDLVAVYRIGRFLDAAVGVIGLGDIDQVGAGLRYTW